MRWLRTFARALGVLTDTVTIALVLGSRSDSVVGLDAKLVEHVD